MTSIPTTQDFLDDLAPALREAAALARRLEGRVAHLEKPGEESRVKAALTAADTEVQELLLDALSQRFIHVALEAEEDTPGVASFSQAGPGCVVIDPIDGTLHFYLEGKGPYGTMVGLALDGEYEAALVALPREGQFFQAIRGQGACQAAEQGEWTPIGGIDRSPQSGKVKILVSYGMPEELIAELRGQGFEVGYACGGALSVAPLLPGVGGCLRWCPDKGVSIRGKVGVLIAAEAGALICREGGAPFPTSLSERADLLLTATNPEIRDRLLRVSRRFLATS